MPKVVTRRCLEQDSNPRPTDHKSNALPLHHRVTFQKIRLVTQKMKVVADTNKTMQSRTADFAPATQSFAKLTIAKALANTVQGLFTMSVYTAGASD